MKKVLIGLGVLGGLALLGVGGTVAWATMAKNARLTQKFEAHSIELPVPMPLTEAELEALRAEKLAEMAPADGEAPDDGAKVVDPLEGIDLEALAMERAVARGKHLVEARFACVECHGRDFSGGTMVDDPAMGTWKGPNLTQGEGSKTRGFVVADWDRIVRHGIKKDGTPAIMPSEDFVGMSDQELSDIIAYVGTFPPKDNVVPAPTFGPIGTMLLAMGQLPLSAEHHHASTAHPALPPASENTVEFGKHLAQICTGCHRPGLEGGPIPIGPPDWPPARNLTAHEQGTKGWSLDDFRTAMREGKRPDGTPLKAPMTLIVPYANAMTDVEMQALWTYIQSLPPTPTGS